MPIAPLIGAALIGGVATIGGAAISASASNKASKAAQQAAADNNALQREVYQKNTALSQPYIDRGNQAADLVSSFLGINGDPAKSKAALDTYLSSTGYQFRLNEGVRAITSNRAASGLLKSGSTLKALDTFGQGTAAQGADDWLSKLSHVSDQGVSAIGAVTGAGTGYANAVSNNNNNAADATGNAALVNAANTSNLLKSLGGSLIGAIGQSSYGKPKPSLPATYPGGATGWNPDWGA